MGSEYIFEYGFLDLMKMSIKSDEFCPQFICYLWEQWKGHRITTHFLVPSSNVGVEKHREFLKISKFDKTFGKIINNCNDSKSIIS